MNRKRWFLLDVNKLREKHKTGVYSVKKSRIRIIISSFFKLKIVFSYINVAQNLWENKHLTTTSIIWKTRVARLFSGNLRERETQGQKGLGRCGSTSTSTGRYTPTAWRTTLCRDNRHSHVKNVTRITV